MQEFECSSAVSRPNKNSIGGMITYLEQLRGAVGPCGDENLFVGSERHCVPFWATLNVLHACRNTRTAAMGKLTSTPEQKPKRHYQWFPQQSIWCYALQHTAAGTAHASTFSLQLIGNLLRTHEKIFHNIWALVSRCKLGMLCFHSGTAAAHHNACFNAYQCPGHCRADWLEYCIE